MKRLRIATGLALLSTIACGEQAKHTPSQTSAAAHEQASTHAEQARAHTEHGDAPAHHDEHGAPELAPTGNAVQQEMQLLTAALESAVRGIGMGDVRPLEHALHRVHAAKDATSQALADGSYRPPKNPDALDRFRELDEAFHAQLGKLVQASRANDLAATADALGEVMQACQGCHGEFRP